MAKLIDLDNLDYFSQLMHQKSKDEFADKNEFETLSNDVTLLAQEVETHTHDDKYMGLVKSTVDLTDSMYDQNTWYPCVSRKAIERKGLHRIICSTQLNGSKPSWSSHTNGFTCICDVLQAAGGWGVTDGAGICLNYQQRYVSDEKNPCGYKHLQHSSRTCFWLRGGGRYDMYTQEGTGWDIYTESTEVSSQTIQPETSCPGVQIEKRSSVYANIAGAITESMIFYNNVGIKGRSTSGATYDICGVDSNNKIYIGWSNQATVHHNNFEIFNQPIQFDNTEFGSMYINIYGDPSRTEFVWRKDDDSLDWNNKFYMANTGKFYASKVVSVGGHDMTWVDGHTMAIIKSNGTGDLSTVKMGDLLLGSSSHRFTISANAPSSPTTGDVWIDI